MSPQEIDFDDYDAYQQALRDQAEQHDPDLETLAQTPEALGYVPDQRDATPDPPALLDPWWILRMRARIEKFKETGEIDWVQWEHEDEEEGVEIWNK